MYMVISPVFFPQFFHFIMCIIIVLLLTWHDRIHQAWFMNRNELFKRASPRKNLFSPLHTHTRTRFLRLDSATSRSHVCHVSDITLSHVMAAVLNNFRYQFDVLRLLFNSFMCNKFAAFAAAATVVIIFACFNPSAAINSSTFAILLYKFDAYRKHNPPIYWDGWFISLRNDHGFFGWKKALVASPEKNQFSLCTQHMWRRIEFNSFRCDIIDEFHVLCALNWLFCAASDALPFYCLFSEDEKNDNSIIVIIINSTRRGHDGNRNEFNYQSLSTNQHQQQQHRFNSSKFEPVQV